MKAYASRTGTKRNLAALRAAGWHLFVSAAGVHRHEGFHFVIECGRWSVSTGALTEADCDDRYKALLASHGRDQFCEGIVAPDVVNGGMDSWRLSLSWLETLLEYQRQVVYLVAQPGIPPQAVAEHLGPQVGVFIGGDSDWKERTAQSWARLAHERGAVCHMGRVNTRRRYLIASAAGCDSFDGSGPSRFEESLKEMERARSCAAQLGLVLQISADIFWEEDGEVWHVRVTICDGAPLEAIVLAAFDLNMSAAGAFEVQTDAGIWSREAGWSFKSWAQLDAEC